MIVIKRRLGVGSVRVNTYRKASGVVFQNPYPLGGGGGHTGSDLNIFRQAQIWLPGFKFRSKYTLIIYACSS